MSLLLLNVPKFVIENNIHILCVSERQRERETATEKETERII